MIFAIDPGTTESGWCIYKAGHIADSGVVSNDDQLRRLSTISWDPSMVLAIEMVASYGMPVGKEVFETCVWIGRFQQAWHTPNAALLVYRRDVKLHLCGNARANDGNIRQALIDKLGPQGVKANPGPTYGVKSHAWAALALAVTVAETLLTQQSLRAA